MYMQHCVVCFNYLRIPIVLQTNILVTGERVCIQRCNGMLIILTCIDSVYSGPNFRLVCFSELLLCFISDIVA